MKKYERFKTVDEIRKQCEAAGIECNTKLYDSGESDFIFIQSAVNGEHLSRVFYSSFNGTFFGTTPDGIEFESADRLDGTPWFDKLLEFFYVEKEGASA